ncbi:MAG: AI-2E family transporter [Zetaproteobacteria bacterium]|nr:MAG: AI-2E family transporter [Zetaproteobacteria bacterium]
MARLRADAQLTMLLASLLAIFLLWMLLGRVLAPLFVAVALAYVLEGVVALLCRLRLPRLLAITLVGLGCLVIVLFSLLALLPLLTEQIGRLVAHVPDYIAATRTSLRALQAHYAGWVAPEALPQLIAAGAGKMQEWGGRLLSFSIASIPGVITLLVYAVLVPVLVFFLLKDKEEIMAWAAQFLPRERTLLVRVWHELDIQIGNYIRGRFWESLAVGLAMWLLFALMDHQYALLLAVLTGISVWVPFVGAVVVGLPVVLLSFFQWGWAEETLYALGAYVLVQLLDANIVIPWLFSEMVNLHPVAIIVAVLLFGSLGGMLGVFLAIPLAALVQSVLTIVIERWRGPGRPA